MTIIVREAAPEAFVEMPMQPTIVGPDGVQHSWQVIDLWTDAELETLNIYRVEPVAPPEGQRLVGYEFGRDANGKVIYIPTFEDIPAPQLPVPTSANKLGLKRALAEIGLWDQVKAAIAADPDIQEEWELAVEIRRTDPLVQMMIDAIGLTPEQVDAILIRANELVA